MRFHRIYGRVAVVDPGQAVDRGIGDHHIRAVPPVGRCACRMAALRTSSAPASTRIPNIGSQHGFPVGTMGGCAGSCRHDVPSCRQDPAAAAPGRARFMDIKCDSTVSDQVRPGRTRMTDRTSEPDRRLDREPPRGPVFKLGMRHGNAPDPPRSPDHHDNRSSPLRSRCLRGPCDHCGAGQIRTACPTGSLLN
jgi:hypothetical protein